LNGCVLLNGLNGCVLINKHHHKLFVNSRQNVKHSMENIKVINQNLQPKAK